jgi:hypothetical protein
MDTRKVLLALFATLAASVMSVTHAQGKITPIDYGVEASTAMVVMPTSTSGSIVLRCANCALRSYPLTSATVLSIGNKAVSLQQFNAYLATLTGGRPMTIFITPDSSRVTRICVSGDFQAGQTAAPQGPAAVAPRRTR